MSDLTYDVRIYKREVYRGKKWTTYYVRWKVGAKEFREPFRNKAQSESFRADLMAAARKGEAFSLTSGRPVSWKRRDPNLRGTNSSWTTQSLSGPTSRQLTGEASQPP